ncbi:glycoside hydrolase family 25 protein [Kriegella aquimaris]|uniref:Lysozyme n=1 Tax=Kriegella aquimaris TaxID=192904 RepID=A0A1G9YRU9_9FLAO|nr:glycoside hydrolase family 25 protein [Kriegella aquimaris]SDN11909.1 lysozyme [Kriegella aquimaris]
MNALDFNPTGTLNALCDISHLNENVDLNKVQSSGILGILHKATQSSGRTLFHDKMYPIRKQIAENLGLLWGAYHFGTNGSGIDQANAFLDYVKPNNDILLVLDFEVVTTPGESNMSLHEARDFVSQVQLKTGKYPGIYGGALLKEVLKQESGIDPILSKCWLWVADYASKPNLPIGWDNYTLWQFTDGVHGPGAVPIDGIGLCDRDIFNGKESELISFWKENIV